MAHEELLGKFKKDLDDLVDNDKYKINALTIFARDHKDVEHVAQGIVDTTIRHVLQISSGLKLLGLYVIDSIVKNVGTPFRKFYTSSIVDAFVHSFQTIRDEKGRLKLYNLRTTWKDIFPNSRMYELDIRVREHDPAWPLLSTPPEAKSAFRSLPNIPKIHTKTELKESDESTPLTETSVVQKSTISSSRDPRLNRKRKSPTEGNPPLAEEFLIDRAGDHKMEAVARKQGKQEQSLAQSKKLPLFGGQDLDMRSLPSPQSPARSAAWSSYINKHSEVCSRRETKDVDMRITLPAQIQSTDDFKPIGTSDSPFSSHVTIASQPTAQASTATVTLINPSCTSVALRQSELHSNTESIIPTQSSAREIMPVSPFQSTAIPPPPHNILAYPNPVRSFPEYPRENPSLLQPYVNGPSPRPVHGPPIRGPVWNVEIDGFPDMINIGVDPRMLSLVSHPKPPRRITIDGRQYSLLLDRVQPLVMIGDQVHAVRFRCDYVNVVINDQCFKIPGTGFAKIFVGSRPYQAYLGGPGHELIIDGKPHTVPFGSQLTFINISYNSVGVKFVGTPPCNVNILPVIPPRLLRWAGQGLFGSPRQIHKPPLNPLSELARLAEGRQTIRFKTFNHGPQFVDSQQVTSQNTEELTESTSDIPAKVDTMANPTPVTTSALLSESLKQTTTTPVNVYELFQRLVKAGIVSDPSTSSVNSTPPDISSYSWDRFKLPCTDEIDHIYKGHQCGQCGSRFQSDLSPEFASHLDYHYMKNIADDTDRRSRNFYQSARYWLLSEMTREGAPQFEPGTPVLDLQECKCPAFADPSKNVCAVCYEKFDVFWDHEEEEWMLRDAVLAHDRVYHPICQEDAGKEFIQPSPAPSPGRVKSSPGDQITVDSASSNPVVITTHSASDNVPAISDVLPEEKEEAFGCVEPTECLIPGLSPDNLRHLSPSPEYLKDYQSEDSKPLPVPVKLEEDETQTPILTRDVVPFNADTISADPLAALKAVLCGGVSSFLTSSSLPQ